MSHLWPLKPARAPLSPRPALPPPPITACPPGDTVPTQPSPGLERQQRLAAKCSQGAPGAVQAHGSRELPARLRIASTHSPPCSSLGHSQAGVKHLLRRSCVWLCTARSGLAEQRLQWTRCRRMSPTQHGQQDSHLLSHPCPGGTFFLNWPAPLQVPIPGPAVQTSSWSEGRAHVGLYVKVLCEPCTVMATQP